MAAWEVLAAAVAGLVVAPTLAMPPPPPEVKTLKNGELELPWPINFVAGTDQMMTGVEGLTRGLSLYLQERPEVTLLRIEAHTTDESDTAKAQLLSERRAMAVARQLVTRYRVDCRRLLPVGFGATKPLYDKSTPQRRAYNARITLVIAALSGKAVGVQPVSGGGKVAGDPCSAP